MTATATIGKIVQIIGPVLDVEFDAGQGHVVMIDGRDIEL